MKRCVAGIGKFFLGILSINPHVWALSPEILPPQAIGLVRAEGRLDVVWQNKDPADGRIHRAELEKRNQHYVVTRKDEVNSLGLLAGATYDEQGNLYHLTSEVGSREDNGPKQIMLYKNNQSYWQLRVQDGAGPCTEPKLPMLLGSSQLASGSGHLFINMNLDTAHAHTAVLDLNQAAHQSDRCAQHRLWHHNFGQKVLFDGTDFVAVENRDHEMTLGMLKFSPGESHPLQNAQERQRSVYARTNHGNSTFTELGGLQPGWNDGEGYLVLFSSERDRDYLMRDLNPPGQGYGVSSEISPRDLGLIHVKRSFDQEAANWRDPGGSWFSMAPQLVDNRAMVNSIGESRRTTYRTVDDGWDWPNYSLETARELENFQITERQHHYAGVQWLTQFGVSYQSAGRIPALDENFRTIYLPKLGRLERNEYVVIWEEYTARRRIYDDGQGTRFHYLEKNYQTTQAMRITLQKEGDQVRIQPGATRNLGSLRLMPQDDPFTLDGKAAWFTYHENGSDLILHTLDRDLNFISQALGQETAPQEPVITVDQVLGGYEHRPMENDWHRGRIIMRGEQMIWENDAQVSWNLFPDLKNGQLRTDETNPYFDPNNPDSLAFQLKIQDGQVLGFTFMNTGYDRTAP